MHKIHVLVGFAVAAIGCGDNKPIEPSADARAVGIARYEVDQGKTYLDVTALGPNDESVGRLTLVSVGGFKTLRASVLGIGLDHADEYGPSGGLQLPIPIEDEFAGLRALVSDPAIGDLLVHFDVTFVPFEPGAAADGETAYAWTPCTYPPGGNCGSGFPWPDGKCCENVVEDYNDGYPYQWYCCPNGPSSGYRSCSDPAPASSWCGPNGMGGCANCYNFSGTTSNCVVHNHGSYCEVHPGG